MSSVRFLQLAVEDLDVAGEAFANSHIVGTLLALTRRDQHLDIWRRRATISPSKRAAASGTWRGSGFTA